MGVGYGPPKANTTDTGDLWAFFGGVMFTWAFGTGVPKAASRRVLVGEVAKRCVAVEAPDDFFTHFEWPGPLPGTHIGRAWPWFDPPDILVTFPVAILIRVTSRTRRPERDQRIADQAARGRLRLEAGNQV